MVYIYITFLGIALIFIIKIIIFYFAESNLVDINFSYIKTLTLFIFCLVDDVTYEYINIFTLIFGHLFIYSVRCFYHVGVIYKVFILSKNDDLNNGNFRILMFFSECIA